MPRTMSLYPLNQSSQCPLRMSGYRLGVETGKGMCDTSTRSQKFTSKTI